MWHVFGGKAQNAGINDYQKKNGGGENNEYELAQESCDQSTGSTKREYVAVDSFIHAFCKLFGHVREGRREGEG